MSAEVTPYVRAVEAAALSYSTPEGVADAVLLAALDVAEMAVVLFAHEYSGRFWGDAPEWMQAAYTDRAASLRMHLLGADS